MRRSLFMHDGVTTRGAAAAPAGVAADFEQLLRHDGATNHFSNCEPGWCDGLALPVTWEANQKHPR
jgi:hypothetical protein